MSFFITNIQYTPKKNVLISRSPNFNYFCKVFPKLVSATRWIRSFCDEEGENIEHLNETFKKETLAKDGENGEKWIGCMTCNQSFHVKCFLMNITQQDWDEGAKKMEKEANRHLKAIPLNEEGKRHIEDPEQLLEMPPYKCLKW